MEKELCPKRSPWLSSMFKKLVKLQKLSISYLPASQGGKLNWMALSERMVLLPLLHLPTLTSISLERIRDFPLADLAGCVNLKQLEITSLMCSNVVGKFLEVLFSSPVMLERLEIFWDMTPVQRLCRARRPDGKPIIDFSSLREIKSQVARLDLMTELFGLCKNLHKIDITSVSPIFIFLHSFDLTLVVELDVSFDHSRSASSLKGLFTMLKPSLPTLVDIYIDYYIDGEIYDGPLAGLCHELEKMAGQNVVETIKLEILVGPDFDCTRWGELDDVLMGSPEGWPALKKVSISFHVSLVSEDDDSDKAIRELPMTKLVESKQVQFNFEVIGFT